MNMLKITKVITNEQKMYAIAELETTFAKVL
jgi:hypothetical protein